jgi:hypothetical protein
MEKTYKQHGKFFKYLTKMLWRARVLPAKTALPKFKSGELIGHPLDLNIELWSAHGTPSGL